MEWMSVDLGNCPLIRALDVVGKQWTIIVLREAFNGVRRFEDFQHHLGLSRSVLSRRLAEMVTDGLLERVPYRPDGERERHEYQPTDKAWALYPVMVGLMQWGDRYLADGDAEPVRLVDRHSGKAVVAALVTDDTATCAPADVGVRPGRSFKTVPAAPSDHGACGDGR
ncbi:winged helix-turn-helix transcriptional regulator [Streptosporangium sp. CA-135522]|uniref:winged helix-turn-helix transcriptional regulator n=1 Tax=Streptosporangium sp. CA-135522 TaxID=3240072 RepID=UPI003D8CA66B